MHPKISNVRHFGRDAAALRDAAIETDCPFTAERLRRAAAKYEAAAFPVAGATRKTRRANVTV